MTDHVVVLHRWRAPYALYESYLDHTRHHVSYVTTEVGAAGVPLAAAGVGLVSATDDIVEVRTAVANLAARYGDPTAIIALKEDDLLTAAQLTVEYGLPGRRPGDLEVFRDKLTMATAVHAIGLAQPPFASASGPADVLAFGDRHGWPVVVKPRRGSSSEGVHVFGSGDIDPTWRAGSDGAIVQSFVDGTLVHVDGIFDDRIMYPWRVSRYVGSPLDFRTGGWLGSVELDDPEAIAVVESYANTLLSALTDRPMPFHLELFLRPDSDGHLSCVFVEVAARVGGAEIPFVWREVHEFDLMGEAFRCALGDYSPEPDRRTLESTEYAGFLLVPSPAIRPCRITSIDRALGEAWAPPELYAEETSAVGEIIPDAAAYYEHVGGRFRFRGRSSSAIEEAIHAVAQQFAIAGTTVEIHEKEHV
ncbi:MAG: hypothetical protein WBD41_21020 [Rhodococcus sp. (in: high G+C Gram-positive bacteria)]|jgi:biotin carboxylase